MEWFSFWFLIHIIDTNGNSSYIRLLSRNSSPKNENYVVFLKLRVSFCCWMKPSGYEHSSNYHLLCWGEQRNSYRFRTTWGGVNDDSIFIFGWSIPLKSHYTIPGTHITYYTSHVCLIFNNVHVWQKCLFTRILARTGILTHNCVYLNV